MYYENGENSELNHLNLTDEKKNTSFGKLSSS